MPLPPILPPPTTCSLKDEGPAQRQKRPACVQPCRVQEASNGDDAGHRGATFLSTLMMGGDEGGG